MYSHIMVHDSHVRVISVLGFTLLLLRLRIKKNRYYDEISRNLTFQRENSTFLSRESLHMLYFGNDPEIKLY